MKVKYETELFNDEISNVLHKIELISINDDKLLTKPVNIMDIIERDDRNLLENNRIVNMTRIDWGKTMSISNQYIQRNILRYMLGPFGYYVYSTDDSDIPHEIDVSNNSQGFDLVAITPDKRNIRIQCKIRQVNGCYDYSQQIHFETTRRNSEKNKVRK